MEMQSVFSGMMNILSASMTGDLGNVSGEEGGNTSFQKIMSDNIDRMKESQTNVKENKIVQNSSNNEKKECSLDEVVDNMDDMEKDSFDKIQVEVEEETLILDTEVNLEMSSEMFEAKEWIEEVQDFLCEELEIDLEELEVVLEQLGIQIIDLRDYSCVQQLVLKVSGEQDKTMLLTNEDLGKQLERIYEGIQEINQLIQEEFSVSDAELQVQLEQLSRELSSNEDNEKDKITMPMQDSHLSEEEMDVDSLIQASNLEKDLTMDEHFLATEAVEQDKQIEISKQPIVEDEVPVEEVELQNKETQTADVEVVAKKDVQSSQDIGEDVTKQEKEIKIDFSVDKQSVRTEEESMSQSSFSQTDEQESEQGLMERFVEHLSSNHITDVENVMNPNEQPIQMREIVNQLVEQIKLLVKPDTTSMEMQLNPENLGKVNLTVVAKDGHVTAHLVTENEITKQALEGQIQQLRDTLGQQGLKVDKVEVSVSNFDFSHSNQANAEEQKQQQKNTYNKNIARIINLDDAVDLNEITEEEQLTRKIMRENGNQVDYTA